jgi:hypothetical protein
MTSTITDSGSQRRKALKMSKWERPQPTVFWTPRGVDPEPEPKRLKRSELYIALIAGVDACAPAWYDVPLAGFGGATVAAKRKSICTLFCYHHAQIKTRIEDEHVYVRRAI